MVVARVHAMLLHECLEVFTSGRKRMGEPYRRRYAVLGVLGTEFLAVCNYRVDRP